MLKFETKVYSKIDLKIDLKVEHKIDLIIEHNTTTNYLPSGDFFAESKSVIIIGNWCANQCTKPLDDTTGS